MAVSKLWIISDREAFPWRIPESVKRGCQVEKRGSWISEMRYMST